MIRVLLADDHPVVRGGLRGMLSDFSDISVVAEAANGLEALTQAHAYLPDVVLMDLRMPLLDGAGATARLAQELPSVRVVVLTTYDTDIGILRAVEAGASGYLLKDATPADLVTAVRAAARGETVLAPPVSRPPGVLSAREVQVLTLVAKGLTNADIARTLHITEATVKTHLLRTFTKLDVADRTAAVTTALSLGLLHLT